MSIRGKYSTPEEAIQAAKESARIRAKKRNEKLKTDPVAKAKHNAIRAKYRANMSPEKKARLREYNRIKKQESRERQKRAALISQFRQYQQKVSTEISTLEM